MAKYRDESKSEILSIANIVDIISERVPLKKAGSLLKGRCPFHQEKTPSFIVNPQKNIYKCFGCGKGGDVIGFLMEYERFDFIQTLEYLAEKYHITLSKEEQPEEDDKKRMVSINLKALSFFKDQFDRNRSKLEHFVNKRKLTGEMIKRFSIGYAPDGFAILYSHLKNSSYSDKILIDLGLIKIAQNGSPIDKFRDRVMFPIFDELGNLSGFGGRALAQKEGVPKYLNSSDSLLYNKSKILYGLFHGKQAILEQKEAIIVEGYLDIISLFKHGIENVVAPCGTSVTEQQLLLLKRYANSLVFCFDGDEAGKAAAIKVAPLSLKLNFNSFVVTLPVDHDPDTYINHFGKDDFLRYVKQHRKDILDYIISYHKSKGIDELEISRMVIELLLEINDPLTVEFTLKKTALKLGVSINALREVYLDKKRQYPQQQKSGETVIQLSESKKTSNIGIKLANIQKNIKDLEIKLFCIFLKYPSLLKRENISSIKNEKLQLILNELFESVQTNQFFSADFFITQQANELTLQQINFIKSKMDDIPDIDEKKEIFEINEFISRLKKLYIHEKIEFLNQEIIELENSYLSSDPEGIKEIIDIKKSEIFLSKKQIDNIKNATQSNISGD